MENQPMAADAPAPEEKPVVAAPAHASSEPRSKAFAFMILLLFGYFGMHKIYLGHKKEGWTRFGLGVASILTLILIVGYLIMLVLAVWTLVDFFMLHLKTTTDAEGQPLTVNKRDAKWEKGIFIFHIVVGVLYVLAVIAAVSLVAFGGVQEKALEEYNSTQFNSSGFYR